MVYFWLLLFIDVTSRDNGFVFYAAIFAVDVLGSKRGLVSGSHCIRYNMDISTADLSICDY